MTHAQCFARSSKEKPATTWSWIIRSHGLIRQPAVPYWTPHIGRIEARSIESSSCSCHADPKERVEGSDLVQWSQTPRTDSEETTSGSTNAAKGNDTKLSVVWPHRKVLQGQRNVSNRHSARAYLQMLEHTQRELNQLQTVILNGSPNVQQGVPAPLRPYWDSRSELAVCDGIIYKGMRIVVPPCLRRQMLNLVHESYLGVIKCKQGTREVLYWPAMNSNVETVKNYSKCGDFQRKQPSEPLLRTETPRLPFVMVGTNLFQFEDWFAVNRITACLRKRWKAWYYQYFDILSICFRLIKLSV